MKKNRYFWVILLYLIVSNQVFAYDVLLNGIYYNLNSTNKTAEVTHGDNQYKTYSGDINIPSSISYGGISYVVNTIGEYSFWSCKITSIIIPSSVTSIGYRAFGGCSALTSLTIPNNVNTIGESAFVDCSGLTSLKIPNSVTSIGDFAFSNCKGLLSITIPQSVTSIGTAAWGGCNLSNIIVDINNPVYDSRDNCNAIIKTSTNELIAGCKTTMIPNSVTSIGTYAFRDCKGLTNISIPKSVVSIGSVAFDGCVNLVSISIPNSVQSINNQAFEGCSGLADITIPNSVRRLGHYVFFKCSSLKSITIPSGVNNIGISIFAGCDNLEKILVESGNKVYDSRNNCNAIINISTNELIAGCKSTIIPSSVTSIGEYAFYTSKSLTSISIPSSISEVKRGAFESCSNLELVKSFIENPFVIDGAFKGLSPSARLEVPKGSKSKYQELSCWAEYFKEIVEFGNPSTYTLSITASGSGSASYNSTTIRGKTSSFTVNEGTSAKISFTPDNGYRIKSVKVNGSTVVVSNNQYTVSNISKNTTVSVEFEAITYTLSITAYGNGSASYSGSTIRSKTSSFTVNAGTSATISFTPDNGYRIKSVKLNNSTVTVSNNQYTISNINANTTVSVEFEAIPVTTYTLSITASGNGSASYSGSTIRGKSSSFTVNAGSSATITFTPDNGYRIKSVKVNNSTVTVSNNQYTVSSISKNTTVSAEFEAITYTLSITASGNGSASYNSTTIRSKTSSFTVNAGSSAKISFTSDNGYRIKSVKVNGSTVTISNNQYTVSNISKNTTVSVEFEAITYTLSITASGNGSATYNSTTIRGINSSFTVNAGTSATITFTPDNGYRIKSVKVNGSTVSVSNNQYTISSINANTTVSVEFETIPVTTYTLSITASGNGSASYNSTTIRGKTTSFTLNEGTSAKITFSPDNGYRIKSVKVNGSTVDISNNQYTISSINANTTVSVEFEAIPPTTYTLLITASGNGSATYNSTAIRGKTTSFTVNEGTSAKITFSPDNGYRIKSVKVNGSTVSVSNNQYTISSINANTTVSVEFEAIPVTTYTLSITASGNGSVSYNGTTIRSKTNSFTVNEGTSTTITFAPDAGYKIASVKVNGTDVTSSVANNMYSISNIITDTKLSVTFEAIQATTYTMSITATGNGYVEYDGNAIRGKTIRGKTSSFSVDEGTNAILKFSADEGNRLKSMNVNGQDVTSTVMNNLYIISNITANMNFEVVFEEISTCLLTINMIGNGAIYYNDGSGFVGGGHNKSVNKNADVLIKFSPSRGNRVAKVKVDNADVTSDVVNNQYVIRNISANTTVSVEFEAIPPSDWIEVDDIWYVFLSTNEVEVTYCKDQFYSGEINIPEEIIYNGSAYSVTSIGNSAFSYCEDLTSVTIGNSVAYIGDNAFYGCTDLTRITIGNSVKTIGDYTFQGCEALTNITIPNSVTHIGISAFQDCTTLNSFTIPNSVTSIGRSAFMECISLASLIIGNNLTSIGDYAFGGCNDLSSIVVSSANTIFDSRDNSNAIIESASNTLVVGCKNTVIPNSVTSIGDFAFKENRGVTSITIPNSVTSIGKYAFAGSSLISFTIPNSVIDIGDGVLEGCMSLVSITIGNSVKRIGNAAFNHCSSLTSITIPSSVIVIGDHTFWGCSNLNSVTIGKNVTCIEEYAFYKCSRLSNVVSEIQAPFKIDESVFDGIPSNAVLGVPSGTKDKYETYKGWTKHFKEVVETDVNPTTYTLSITSSGNGSASYNGATIRSKTSSFTVNEGTSAMIIFSPDNGYRIKNVKVNNSTVSVRNNQYTVSDISKNTTVEVEFEAVPPTTCILSITAFGNGSASYGGSTIRGKTSSFTVNAGTSATITFSPDNGYRIRSVKENNTVVTSYVSNGIYTINSLSRNTTVEVEFEEILQAFSADDVNYTVVSFDQHTIRLAKGGYGITLEVPAKVSYQNAEWTVTGIDNGALANNLNLAAIVWNPDVAFTEQVGNPNFLLYVNQSKYAPSSIKNVVVNGNATSITLTDAASGNNFHCPQAFTAQKISYTHNYSMKTGIGKAQGWETIALPFDVQKVTHESKGEIVSFANWRSGDSKRPFWLMQLSASGWTMATSIKANTPYIISMPNNDEYKSGFLLNGRVTFSAENVSVAKTENLSIANYSDRTFVPTFASLEKSNDVLALNVVNDIERVTGGSTEGSTFERNLRPIHPFEAYMTSTSSTRSIGIDEGMATGIIELITALSDEGDLRIYNLNGQLIKIEEGRSLDEVMRELPAGVYIVNGKKMIIR